jgi:hypothetical protein
MFDLIVTILSHTPFPFIGQKSDLPSKSRYRSLIQRCPQSTMAETMTNLTTRTSTVILLHPFFLLSSEMHSYLIDCKGHIVRLYPNRWMNR